MNEKLQNKVENFNNALKRLNEMSIKFRKCNDGEMKEIYRDALIQRFEFTFELAWKTLYEYMTYNGLSVRTMPREILKSAYQCELINNEQVWLDMLESRNVLSHVYEEEQASAIAEKISLKYSKEFSALKQIFQN